MNEYRRNGWEQIQWIVNEWEQIQWKVNEWEQIQWKVNAWEQIQWIVNEWEQIQWMNEYLVVLIAEQTVDAVSNLWHWVTLEQKFVHCWKREIKIVKNDFTLTSQLHFDSQKFNIAIVEFIIF